MIDWLVGEAAIDPDDVAGTRTWPASGPERSRIDVSTIVPCYQLDDAIEDVLESIAMQIAGGEPAVEVLLVVDGREQDWARVVALLDGKTRPYPFVTRLIMLRRNLGTGLARCHGWAMARGEFVAFTDDDDVWMPGKLAAQLELHRKYPEQIASGHGYSASPADLAGDAPAATPASIEARPCSMASLLLGRHISPCTVMIRRALWPAGLEPFRIGEDCLLHMTIAARQAILYWPQVLATRSAKAPAYYADPHSLSRQRWPSRKAQWRNYCILSARGLLHPAALLPLFAMSLALTARRAVLDLTRWLAGLVFGSGRRNSANGTTIEGRRVTPRPTWAELLLAVVAWFLIGLASLSIVLVPFRRLHLVLGQPIGAVSCLPLVNDRQFWRAVTVKRAIRRAAQVAPFRSNCLPQALVAAVLCRLFGIPLSVHLGVRRAEGAKLEAHAWACAGAVTVSGGPSFGAFDVVSCFLRVPDHAKHG